MSNASKILILIKWLKVYSPVLATAIFTTILSGLVFLAVSYEPDLTHALYLSTNTPWGIVTSIFLHETLMHLSSNIRALWFLTAYVIMPPSLLSMEQIKRLLKSFIPIVFGAAIVANVTWLILSRPGAYSYGASGLVYAVSGTVVGYLVLKIGNVASRFKDPQVTKRRKAGVFILNIFFLLLFLVPIVFYPYSFLGVAPGVNAFVHDVAFIIGLIAAYFGEYLKVTIGSLRKL